MAKRQSPILVARQGDVGVLRRTGIVATVPVPADPDGSAVVARGEVTGHRHRFAREEGVTLRCEREDTRADRLLAEIGAGAASLVHEEHGPVPVRHGDELRVQRTYQYGASRRVED